jgi:hypothetical protein
MGRRLLLIGSILFVLLAVSGLCFSQGTQDMKAKNGVLGMLQLLSAEFIKIPDDCICCGVCVTEAPDIFEEDEEGCPRFHCKGDCNCGSGTCTRWTWGGSCDAQMIAAIMYCPKQFEYPQSCGGSRMLEGPALGRTWGAIKSLF